MEYYFLINDKLKTLCKTIEAKFLNSPKPAYYEHSLRVANYCYQIGMEESIDLDIIVASSLIHDIGRVIKPSFSEHINGTKEIGYQILLDSGYTIDETNMIMGIALSHHPKKDEILTNIYEQILFDADNLESVGVFGIIKWYVNISSSLDNVIEDAKMYIDNFSFNNRPSFFYTKYAQKIGEHLIAEELDCANKMIKFCEASIKQNNSLCPLSIGNKVGDINE